MDMDMDTNMDTITTLRTCYLLTALAILVAYALPALRDRFLVYGPRYTPAASRTGLQDKQALHIVFLNRLAAIKVPHSWFKHFYMVSVVSSLVWLQQLYIRGSIFQSVSSMTSGDRPSMSFNQLVLCWTLLSIQGSRRLYESIIFVKPSQSQMWVGHYLLGLLHYMAMGIAIWIEGVPALRSTGEPLGDAAISAPSLSTFIFLPVFLLASGIQHDAHGYLSSLRKYELPCHPAFAGIVSPHYTAESALYLSLTFLAAPKGQVVNGTLLAASIFVVVELGVSAEMTRRWYMQNFGEHLVGHKRRMIPGIW